MCGGVANRLALLQKVVADEQRVVAPTVGTELHQADERSERDHFEKRPQGHFVAVLADKRIAGRQAHLSAGG